MNEGFAIVTPLAKRRGQELSYGLKLDLVVPQSLPHANNYTIPNPVCSLHPPSPIPSHHIRASITNLRRVRRYILRSIPFASLFRFRLNS